MVSPLDLIRKDIAGLSFAREIIATVRDRNSIEINAAYGSLKSILVSSLYDAFDVPLIWVFAEQDSISNSKIDIEHLLPVKSTAVFPQPRKSKWGHDDVLIVSQQADAVNKLYSKDKHILLISYDALQTRIKSRKELDVDSEYLSKGVNVAFSSFVKKLKKIGFEREPAVEKPGDFAVRGGIIDIYPFTAEDPVRLEFWGDELESLRVFDVQTQRSSGEIESIRIFPKPSSEKKKAVSTTVLENLPPEMIVVFDDVPRLQAKVLGYEGSDSEQSLNGLTDEQTEIWDLFLSYFNEQAIAGFSTLHTNLFKNRVDVGSKRPIGMDGDIKRLIHTYEKQFSSASRNYFLCETAGHANRVKNLLEDFEMKEDLFQVLGLNLAEGFNLPAAQLSVITDHEFYGRNRRHQGKTRFKSGLTLKQLKSLNYNDYVVHIDHGLAKFIGLQKDTVRGHERECLVLLYQDSDKLYVPMDKMDRVQKYTGKDGVVPSISKLGGKTWQRLKERTKSKAKQIAKELIQLYSQRKAQKGHAFSSDTTWQKELEASFPYEDTADQYKAVVETKNDMEKVQPMDRLICGDVGFGKTEVAIRAAFKAVQDGKQVAVLVPTTILADQHFITFSERLNRFPVKVDVISRFRTAAEQRSILEKLAKGEVDIIVGTHRIISKDIKFNDLGLLIIDEEHRFGVNHKEKIKQLKVNVDVLALSATPIPRTLQMSIASIRDMSQISTPPNDRLPVHTETVLYDPQIIREAILFELQRGGQVFVVHNRVETIQNFAGKIAEIVPEADIVVAHGQMKGPALEKVMVDFTKNKFQILVSTMIIESGLDMPNVNTILINRADRFGLAQLYQLRGRVGRSHSKAFCYLIVPPLHSLKPETVRRLETVEEFTDLGSGIQIAMRDLEIRGAGNILGAAQSGFIDAMGLEVYMKILEDAVKELKEKDSMNSQNQENVLEKECRIEADVSLCLPETYVELPSERVEFYRIMAHAKDVNEIITVRTELRDRFGRLPAEAENLLWVSEARILGRVAGFRRIVVRNDTVSAFFSRKLVEGPVSELQDRIIKIVDYTEQDVEFLHDKEMVLKLTVDKSANTLETLSIFLKSIYNGFKGSMTVDDEKLEIYSSLVD